MKRTSNSIFYQVEELIQGVLGYLVQGFGNSPTEISKFLYWGELCRGTDPAIAKLCTWGFLHIQEDVKLHILSGGGINPGGSWLLGAGVWEFSHTNFEIFGFWGTLVTHRSSHRPDRDMGIGTY